MKNYPTGHKEHGRIKNVCDIISKAHDRQKIILKEKVFQGLKADS